MPTQLVDEVYVSAPMVERDSTILFDAPLILRILHRRNITAETFFDLLKAGLARGLEPEDWLLELVNTGQIALASRLMRQVGGTSAGEIRQFRGIWEQRCGETFRHTQRRIETQRTILDPATISELEELLSSARQLADEWWFDLALEECAEVERLIDIYVAEANEEREQRWENAQEQIKSVRREYMYSEAVVRQNNTMNLVWDLLSFADRLSASADCDIQQIEELCYAVRQLYQGAPPNSEMLSRYRQLFELQPLPSPTPTLPMVSAPEPVDASVPIASKQLAELKLQREPLSGPVRMVLNDLLGNRPSLIQNDLTRIATFPIMSWSEEVAREHMSRSVAFWVGFADDDARITELLQSTSYLLRYWTDRRRILPEDVRRVLNDNLFYYASARANHLLKNGRWDAASEYYRVAFRLRPRLIGAERGVLNYLAAYAIHVQAPNRVIEVLREHKDLGPDQLILLGLQMAFEYGDELARFWIALGLVKLAAEEPRLFEATQLALHEIEKNSLRSVVGACFEHVSQALSLGRLPQRLDQSLKTLVDGYNRITQLLDGTLLNILRATTNLTTIRTAINTIAELGQQGYSWEPTEQEMLTLLGKIADGLTRYLSTGLSFQDRDRLFENLQRDIVAIENLIVVSPTRIGVVYLNRIADNIQLLLEEDYASLRQTSLPTMEVRVEQNEWRFDHLYYCHLRIENLGEMRADDVRVRAEESPIGEYQVVDSDQQLGSIYNGQARSLHVRVKPTPLKDNQEAFALFIRLQYQIPQRADYEVRSIRLRIENFENERLTFVPIKNPYVVGGIVQNPLLFRGRSELLEALRAEVTDQERTGSIVIFGQKRSGKSSLLFHLSRNVPDFIIPITFDIPTVLLDLPRDTGSSQEDVKGPVEDEIVGRLLFALIRRIVRDCNSRDIVIEPMSWQTLMSPPGPSFQFRQFLDQFRERPDRLRLLLIFDEFTALIDKIRDATIEGPIMKLLKSLIEQGYFSCVICGLTEMYHAVKRYANQLAVSQPRQVDYLSQRAAFELIDEPIKIDGSESRFSSDQVIEEIFELTAGSPFYIQMFCHRLVEYMNRMQITRLTAADIDEVTKSLIEGHERIDPVQFDNLYLYKESTDVDDHAAILEGLVVHVMAHETATRGYVPVTTLSRRLQELINQQELDETLARLEQRRTIIQQAEDPTKSRRTRQPLRSRQYRIRVDLFRRWLLTNRPLDEEALISFRRKLQP